MKDSSNKPEESDPEIRKFGYLLILGFPLTALFWLLLLRLTSGEWQWTIAGIILAAGTIAGVISIVLPNVGRHIHRFWQGLIRIIDFIVSHTLLAVFFFLILTPAGFVVRNTKRLQFESKIDPSRRTYWREPSEPKSLRSYFRQF